VFETDVFEVVLAEEFVDVDAVFGVDFDAVPDDLVDGEVLLPAVHFTVEFLLLADVQHVPTERKEFRARHQLLEEAAQVENVLLELVADVVALLKFYQSLRQILFAFVLLQVFVVLLNR